MLTIYILNKIGKIFCGKLFDHYSSVGYVPEISGNNDCFVFDQDIYEGKKVMKFEAKQRVDDFCGKVSVRNLKLF